MVVKVIQANVQKLSCDQPTNHYDVQTSSNAKEWPQILAIITACLSSLSAGIFLAWPSPSIPIIISPEFPGNVTLAQATYLTILPSVSFALASPLFAILPDRIGRKLSLLLFTAGPQLAAWIIIAATPAIEWLYVSRLLSGVAESCVFAVLPMYIGEVATPKVREIWGHTLSIGYAGGGIIMNSFGLFLSIEMAAIALATIPTLFLCVFSFMPDSPYYLIMKGDKKTAKESLYWLRNGRRSCSITSEHTEREFIQLTADMARQLSERGTIKDLFCIPSNRKAIAIAVSIRIMQLYSGIAVYTIYTQYLFQQTGGVDSKISTIIFQGIYLFFTICSSKISDILLDRRKAMIISFAMVSAALALLSTFLYLKEHTSLDVSPVSWFPIFAMVAYVFGASVGLITVPTILLSELFSSSIKGKALCLANINFAINTGTSTALFQVLMTTYGLYLPFAVFAALCLISSILSYYIIPNTSMKTLEEIQMDFKCKS